MTSREAAAAAPNKPFHQTPASLPRSFGTSQVNGGVRLHEEEVFDE